MGRKRERSTCHKVASKLKMVEEEMNEKWHGMVKKI